MTLSQQSHPNAPISAREVGKSPAGGAPARFSLTLVNKGAAVCTPAIRPDPSPDVDGIVALFLVALDQQGDAVARAGHFPLQILHRGDAGAVDAEHHVARLHPGSLGG